MEFRWPKTVVRCALALAFLLTGFPSDAEQKGSSSSSGAAKTRRKWKDEPMVDLAKECPAIRIELRYATARNLTGKPIYPSDARCLIRQSVARRLQHAQDELHAQGFGLKVWDAYRPAWAQEILWAASPNPEFLQAPSRAASMHTYGVAVDATIVDLKGRPLKMPTDFDDFTPAASMRYYGIDPDIAQHLLILQTAMGNAGFLGMRNEWWHFIAKDYAGSKPVDMNLSLENPMP